MVAFVMMRAAAVLSFLALTSAAGIVGSFLENLRMMRGGNNNNGEQQQMMVQELRGAGGYTNPEEGAVHRLI